MATAKKKTAAKTTQRLNEFQFCGWLNSIIGDQTIKEFADKLGLKKSVVHNFLYGHRPPTKHFLGLLKDAGHGYIRSETIIIADMTHKPSKTKLRKPTGRPPSTAPKMQAAA